MDKDLVPLSPEETIRYLPQFHFPPYITLAHLFHAPEGWSVSSRAFPQYALQYVVKGIAKYEIEGNVYTTKQGDLILHKPHERNSISTLPGEPYICISLVFHFGNHVFPLQPWTEGIHYCGNYSNHPVEQLLTQLVASYKHIDPEHQLKCQGLLLQIMAEITDWIRYKDARTGTPHSNRNKLILIKNYLMEHSKEPLDYKQLEEISGLSRSYLIAQFKS